MRTVTAAVIGLAVMAAAVVTVWAHPMTYKGTVVSVAAASVEVKAMDDMTKKEVTKTFKVTDKTKVFRGDAVVTFAAAKVQKDERIAVTINMDEASDVAEEIRLAASSEMSAVPPAAAKAVAVTGCVAVNSGHYMLTNGMMAGETAGKSYDLVGGNLKAHVGHKVTVTGRVQPMAMGKGSLRVTTVKMLAASCSIK